MPKTKRGRDGKRVPRRGARRSTKRAAPTAAAPPKHAPGTIHWHDLTVDDADRVRDFYAKVVGWTVEPVDMGGYADYAMKTPAKKGAGSEMAAGICWRRGVNADLPPQWLVYVNVADLRAALVSCLELGGEIVTGPRDLAGGRFAVIRDPAGAVCGLFQPPSS